MQYQDGVIPKNYVCNKCGTAGVKLWRQYQTFLNHIELMCCCCAAKDQDKDISDIGADGRSTSETGNKNSTIGWLVPAVPTEDETTYWGYTSVPQLGLLWWRRLPTRVGDEPSDLTGAAMLVQSVQESLKAIEAVCPAMAPVCSSVLDAAKRLATMTKQ